MRRKEREVTDTSELESWIKRAEICRLGLCDGDMPYIVPLNYGYESGAFYFHCAAEGKKVELIRKNNKACFEIEVDTKIRKGGDVAAKWSMDYKSIIGFGKIVEIEDTEEKKHALSLLMQQYTDKYDWDYPEKLVERVMILKLEIDSMTGKSTEA